MQDGNLHFLVILLEISGGNKSSISQFPFIFIYVSFMVRTSMVKIDIY